jgi:hypothetical protein
MNFGVGRPCQGSASGRVEPACPGCSTSSSWTPAHPTTSSPTHDLQVSRSARGECEHRGCRVTHDRHDVPGRLSGPSEMLVGARRSSSPTRPRVGLFAVPYRQALSRDVASVARDREGTRDVGGCVFWACALRDACQIDVVASPAKITTDRLRFTATGRPERRS